MSLYHQIKLAYPDKAEGADYYLINRGRGAGLEVLSSNFTIEQSALEAVAVEAAALEANEAKQREEIKAMGTPEAILTAIKDYAVGNRTKIDAIASKISATAEP